MTSFFLRKFCDYFGYKYRVDDSTLAVNIIGADCKTLKTRLCEYALKYAEDGSAYLTLIGAINAITVKYDSINRCCVLA